MSVGMVWEGPGEASDRDGLPLGSHVARIGDDANAKQPRLRALGKMRLLRHGRGKKVRQSRVLAGCRDFWTSVKTAGSKPLPAGGLLKNTLLLRLTTIFRSCQKKRRNLCVLVSLRLEGN